MTSIIPIDISNSPDLLRLTEEVAATRTPRKLTYTQKKTVTILMPVAQTTEEAYKASLKTIGSWSDLNKDDLIAHITQARSKGSRPTIRP